MQVSKIEIIKEFDRAKKYLENRDDLNAVRDLENLTEKEKESDRVWADKVIHIFKEGFQFFLNSFDKETIYTKRKIE